MMGEKPDRGITWDEYAEREQPFLLSAERELDLTPYEVHEEQLRPPPAVGHARAELMRTLGWAALGTLVWVAAISALVVWVSR
jgi:hypothetical protein